MIRKMKRLGHLYERLIDADYLETCVHRAFKKKKKTSSIRRILENPRKHAERISQLIQSGKLPCMRERKIKMIRDGKQNKWRSITKASDYEHILHHAIVGLLEQRFVNSSYRYSVSSIPRRGDLYGMKHMRRWIRSYRGRKLYVLKFDIKKFFDTVDRAILFNKLTRLVKDKKFLDILHRIVYYDGSSTNRGIPIGYYTSQWFSNYFLQSLDNYIKQDLRVRHMMRYADDIVILSQNKRRLHRVFSGIREYLSTILILGIKKNWQVFMLSYRPTRLMVEDGWDQSRLYGRPLDFMGYKFYPWKITIRKTTLRSAMRAAIRFCIAGTTRLAMSLMSYLGRLAHAMTHSYCSRRIYHLATKANLSRVISHSYIIPTWQSQQLP